MSKVSKATLARLATSEASLAAAKTGRKGGIEGKRKSDQIMADLARAGCKIKADWSAHYAALAVAILANHGGLRKVCGADGKPGEWPLLASLSGLPEEVVAVAVRIPPLGRCRGGYEVVDGQGRVWRNVGGKPTPVVQLKTENKVTLASLAACQGEKALAERAAVWMEYHLDSEHMVGSIRKALPKAVAETEAAPETAEPEPETEAAPE